MKIKALFLSVALLASMSQLLMSDWRHPYSHGRVEIGSQGRGWRKGGRGWDKSKRPTLEQIVTNIAAGLGIPAETLENLKQLKQVPGKWTKKLADLAAQVEQAQAEAKAATQSALLAQASAQQAHEEIARLKGTQPSSTQPEPESALIAPAPSADEENKQAAAVDAAMDLTNKALELISFLKQVSPKAEDALAPITEASSPVTSGESETSSETIPLTSLTPTVQTQLENAALEIAASTQAAVRDVMQQIRSLPQATQESTSDVSDIKDTIEDILTKERSGSPTLEPGPVISSGAEEQEAGEKPLKAT